MGVPEIRVDKPRQPSASWNQALWRLRALYGDRIPIQPLGIFFDQFAVLLASGASIPHSLEVAARDSDPEWQAICAEVVAPVSAGGGPCRGPSARGGDVAADI